MAAEFTLTPFEIILGILAAAPTGLTTSEIATAINEASYNAAGRLYKMSKRGLIEQTKTGGKARWRLPPAQRFAD